MKHATRAFDFEIRAVKGEDGVTRYPWVLSTDEPCKDGVIVAQNWDLSEYERNPVLMVNHSQHDVHSVIGQADNVRLEGGRLMGDLRFADELDEETGEPINAEARQIRNMVDKGYIRAGSVGMMVGSVDLRRQLPKESPYYSDDDETGHHMVWGARAPNVLLEFSIVAIGADSNALKRSLDASPVPVPVLLRDLILNDPDVREAVRQVVNTEPEVDDSFDSWYTSN